MALGSGGEKTYAQCVVNCPGLGLFGLVVVEGQFSFDAVVNLL